MDKKQPLVERRTSPWREIVEVFYAEVEAEPREPEPAVEPATPRKAR